jgi:hypothetical protein
MLFVSMSKAGLLARMQAAGDALTETFRRVPADAWATPIKANGYTPHDYLNYILSVIELAGNAYLQSLRMDPVMMEAEIDAEARRNVERRKLRAVATDFDDYLASLRGMLILLDMADEEQIAEVVQGRSREDRFDVLVGIMQRLNGILSAWLGGRG